MPNKCVVVGYNTGHKKGKRKREKQLEVPQTIPVSSENKAKFHFPRIKCQMVKICKQG